MRAGATGPRGVSKGWMAGLRNAQDSYRFSMHFVNQEAMSFERMTFADLDPARTSSRATRPTTMVSQIGEVAMRDVRGPSRRANGRARACSAPSRYAVPLLAMLSDYGEPPGMVEGDPRQSTP